MYSEEKKNIAQEIIDGIYKEEVAGLSENIDFSDYESARNYFNLLLRSLNGDADIFDFDNVEESTAEESKKNDTIINNIINLSPNENQIIKNNV